MKMMKYLKQKKSDKFIAINEKNYYKIRKKSFLKLLNENIKKLN